MGRPRQHDDVGGFAGDSRAFLISAIQAVAYFSACFPLARSYWRAQVRPSAEVSATDVSTLTSNRIRQQLVRSPRSKAGSNCCCHRQREFSWQIRSWSWSIPLAELFWNTF